MDQDDLEDEVFSQTILIQAEILYKWQKRYVLQTEVLYALAFVLSVALCWAKKTGLLVLTVGGPSEESSEQKVADAAVFALKGRRATMEDRFAMIQVPVPHLPDQPIVRIFAILDGHGGQVSDTHCLKITQNIAFEFWHFLPIFVLLKLTCLVTLFDRKLQVFKNSPNWTFFGIFD